MWLLKQVAKKKKLTFTEGNWMILVTSIFPISTQQFHATKRSANPWPCNCIHYLRSRNACVHVTMCQHEARVYFVRDKRERQHYEWNVKCGKTVDLKIAAFNVNFKLRCICYSLLMFFIIHYDLSIYKLHFYF